MYLFNPISSRHIRLPRLDTLHEQEDSLLVQRPVKKLIISCSPDSDDCRALIIFGLHRNLAFCSPAHSELWTQIGKIDDSYSDIVYSSRQQLYFASKQTACHSTDFPKQAGDGIQAWDLGNPSSPKKIQMQVQMEEKKDEPSYYSIEQCFLVPYSNELFLLRRFLHKFVDPSDGSYHSEHDLDDKGLENTLHKTLFFNVYKYDTESKLLIYMDNSFGDDVALFIGSNHSFGISTIEFPELKPNSIYFTDIIPQLGIPRNEIIGGHDNGIFNYKDKTFSPCYYPCDLKSFQRIKPAPIWFVPTHSIN